MVIVLGGCDESASTALDLAERLHARGHRVSVAAHGEATELSHHGSHAAERISGLLRRGVEHAPVDWVVDGASGSGVDGASGPGERGHVAGVVEGDAGELWALVRAADVVLSPGSGGGPGSGTGEAWPADPGGREQSDVPDQPGDGRADGVEREPGAPDQPGHGRADGAGEER
ncbi:hypothetical protein ER308_12160 [Egibacter rhizosphaerae]|uniref:Uncharacterized protein n=1 Tax=Egibacter rhizosphaerae TaxID=1670831 RepID=A0A411YGN5_9ACTN|nr:hypothetical protein [Egibacter rhizosphaerae]QBI20242.1 hypothetical protein ER308_12160 [Egibacter rhizosphaerae]